MEPKVKDYFYLIEPRSKKKARYRIRYIFKHRFEWLYGSLRVLSFFSSLQKNPDRMSVVKWVMYKRFAK